MSDTPTHVDLNKEEKESIENALARVQLTYHGMRVERMPIADIRPVDERIVGYPFLRVGKTFSIKGLVGATTEEADAIAAEATPKMLTHYGSAPPDADPQWTSAKSGVWLIHNPSDAP
jgi:hypothetical protein